MFSRLWHVEWQSGMVVTTFNCGSKIKELVIDLRMYKVIPCRVKQHRWSTNEALYGKEPGRVACSFMRRLRSLTCATN